MYIYGAYNMLWNFVQSAAAENKSQACVEKILARKVVHLERHYH